MNHPDLFARIERLAQQEFRTPVAQLDYMITQYEKAHGVKPITAAPEQPKEKAKRRKVRSDKGSVRSDAARERIRQALLAHWEEKKEARAKRRSVQHRRAISRGMKKYWSEKKESATPVS